MSVSVYCHEFGNILAPFLDFGRVRVLFVLGFKARRNLHFLHANLFVRFLELYVQRLYGNYHHIHMTTNPSSLFYGAKQPSFLDFNIPCSPNDTKDDIYFGSVSCKGWIKISNMRVTSNYRSGTVNSKFHLIRSFFEIFATFLLFHV